MNKKYLPLIMTAVLLLIVFARKNDVEPEIKPDVLPMQTTAVKEISTKYEKINTESFKEKVDSGEHTVLDVRTPEEYESGRVSEISHNIDFYASDFESKLNELDKDEKYLVYCRSGNRSGKTTTLMKDLGFTEVYELQGGINAWKQNYELIPSCTNC